MAEGIEGDMRHFATAGGDEADSRLLFAHRKAAGTDVGICRTDTGSGEVVFCTSPEQWIWPTWASFLGCPVNEPVLERMERAGFQAVRDSHGYLIQHQIGAERSVTELARRMDVTQQAASKAVAELMALGILDVTRAKDRRAKRVRLPRRGWEAVEFGRRVRRAIEERLVEAAGKKNHLKTKAVLVRCLRALGGVERIRLRRVRQPR